MHLLLNGYFLHMLNTGTGQYTWHLLRALDAQWDGQISVLVPDLPDVQKPEGLRHTQFYAAKLPFKGAVGKLWFEQQAIDKAERSLHPDVMHVPYFGPPLGYVAPLVITVHDLIQLIVPEMKGGPLVRLYNRFAAKGAREAYRILADSEHTRQTILQRLDVEPEQVRTVYLGCDPRFSPDPQPGEEARLRERYGLEGAYILYIGGLHRHKNVETLVRAYAASGCTQPLAIAGEARSHKSAAFPDLHATAQAAGVTDRVRFLGWVEEEDKPRLYRHAQLFVYPSRYEGFGLTPLEALACGTPVLCSNAASLPEVVGDAALQFDPDDEAGLSALLTRVLSDPVQLAELRDRGPARAAQFRWETAAQQTIAVYQEAVRKHEAILAR